MKGINIAYWVVTIIFAGFMIFTAIPNVTANEDSVKLISDFLGYPKYFIPFIGIAKILGSIVILIPGLRSLKEWAYAGLCFDLAGAIYSVIHQSPKVDASIIFMILPIVFLFISYFLWRKKEGIS